MTEWATLSLNPKIDSDGGTDGVREDSNPKILNPICPSCKEQIKSVETEHIREFRCGCDELKEFRFRKDEK